ncbi:MAG: DUF885 domain-containing protein [Candidatus Dormibacteria bacterium]
MSELDQIARGYLEDSSRLDPINAFARGDLEFAEAMTDFSPAGEAARAELAGRALTLARASAPRSDPDRRAKAAMLDRLQVEVDLFEAGEWMRGLNVFGPQVQIRGTFDLMATESEADWSRIAAKLAAVPAAIAGFQATLEVGRQQRVMAARRQALACAAQTRAWSGQGRGSGFFSALAARYQGGDLSLEDGLRRAARAADTAYLGLTQYLERDYAASAPLVDGVGPERYQLHCRYFNGLDLDLEETYAFGWVELARIEREMALVAERIAPGAGMAGAVALLESDPERSIVGEADFRAWNQDFLDRTMAALDGPHFDIPAPVRRVEALIAPPGGSPAMYYTPPSKDFSRPGRTWYPTLGRTRFPLWNEVSTAYHEGVPGHHLQLAQVCYLDSQLNPFQTLLGAVSGHIEGWALYAERLMGELGFLENPDYQLGMLASQSMRAARVVVDIGLHLGQAIPPQQAFHPGERWDWDLAVAFMMEKARRSQQFCAGEVDRYLGVPAQAIAYKVGERAWLEARDEARRAWGGRFRLKEFHRRALELGCVGLGQLRWELGRPLPEETPPAAT